jgi:hypothetical protein
MVERVRRPHREDREVAYHLRTAVLEPEGEAGAGADMGDVERTRRTPRAVRHNTRTRKHGERLVVDEGIGPGPTLLDRPRNGAVDADPARAERAADDGRGRCAGAALGGEAGRVRAALVADDRAAKGRWYQRLSAVVSGVCAPTVPRQRVTG